ncbi:putative carboxylesterase [uncultured delta proteobacterium]|uniref:Putative carboxylesterase n=1 Tax=uncultured delta proteobacterium TaxID=34034 RepID=A0A212ITI0_9DELT|nr:putative carboxylesterase [uncultured delta proteobacterium]
MAQETKTGAGCLFIHGYGGSTFEMEGLAAAIAETGMEARLVCLPGHGEGHEDFRKYRFSDWMAHAEKEFRAMADRCGRVVIVGFSMGGTIALHLASRYPVAGVAALSAPLFVLGFWPWPLENLKFYAHTAVSQARRLLGLHTPHAGETSRDIAPWKGYGGPLHFGQLMSMREGCAVTRVLLPKLTAPILLMHDARDGLVNADNAWAIARRVSSTETTVILTRIQEDVTRHHVITTHRETAGLVAETVAAFCREKMLDP